MDVVLGGSGSEESETDSYVSDTIEESEAGDVDMPDEDNNANISGDGTVDEEHVATRSKDRLITWDIFTFCDDLDQNWIPSFQERNGVLVNTTDFESLNYFMLFFPEDLFSLMVKQTNLFAEQLFATHPNLTANATTSSEMKAFVALQIAMGLNCKPTVQDHWRKYWLTEIQFSAVMSRDRYLLLASFLHFADNSERVERGNQGYNPLFKIQPVLDIVTPIYQQVYGPGKNLSVDESIIKFKGRIYFRQYYLPAKPTKWGIKVFVLCEAKKI